MGWGIQWLLLFGISYVIVILINQIVNLEFTKRLTIQDRIPQTRKKLMSLSSSDASS